MAIPNDPTNLGRALLLLQKEKLITLKEGKGLLPTALDITDNPRHLQIMELEGAQLPRVLDDPKVDVAIISTTYIQQTGLSPVHDSVFIEDKNSPYVNILVAREDNKNAENVKEFLQSYQSSEVAKAAETIFNGAWLVILTHAAPDDLFFWRGDGNPLKSKSPMTESAAFPASPAM